MFYMWGKRRFYYYSPWRREREPWLILMSFILLLSFHSVLFVCFFVPKKYCFVYIYKFLISCPSLALGLFVFLFCILSLLSLSEFLRWLWGSTTCFVYLFCLILLLCIDHTETWWRHAHLLLLLSLSLSHLKWCCWGGLSLLLFVGILYCLWLSLLPLLFFKE